MSEKGVAFTEKLIDQDDAAKNEMMKESDGFLGVPFVVFTKDDGAKEKVLGFDRGRVNEILGIS